MENGLACSLDPSREFLPLPGGAGRWSGSHGYNYHLHQDWPSSRPGKGGRRASKQKHHEVSLMWPETPDNQGKLSLIHWLLGVQPD